MPSSVFSAPAEYVSINKERDKNRPSRARVETKVQSSKEMMVVNWWTDCSAKKRFPWRVGTRETLKDPSCSFNEL